MKATSPDIPPPAYDNYAQAPAMEPNDTSPSVTVVTQPQTPQVVNVVVNQQVSIMMEL